MYSQASRVGTSNDVRWRNTDHFSPGGDASRFNPMSLDAMLNNSDPDESIISRAPHRRSQLIVPLSSPLACGQRIDLLQHSPTVAINTYGQPQGQPAGGSRKYKQRDIACEASRRRPTSRPPRIQYEEEMGLFIWYQRTDLGKAWDEVLRAFDKQYRQERHKTGLQCKFYRVLKIYNVERVRQQTRGARGVGTIERDADDIVGAYGVVQRTNQRFSWMQPEHRIQPPLPQFT